MDREYQGACSVNLYNDRAERDHGDKYPSLDEYTITLYLFFTWYSITFYFRTFSTE